MTYLAVFDCDGTLVDSQRRIIRAMEMAFEDIGLSPPSAAATRRSVGLALPNAVAAVAPEETDPEQLLQLTDNFRDSYRSLLTDPEYEEPLFPGAVNALDKIAEAGILLAIATGKGRRGLELTLERHNLRDRFAGLKTADDGPSKPNPKILLDVMAELGASNDCTIMLGDTSHDMAMARAARVPSIGVAWGYHPPKELKIYGAAEIINSYEQAPSAVIKILGCCG
jgi:phosphoglycolate phosphatase